MWFVELSNVTRGEFGSCASLVKALSGYRILVSDLSLHETVGILHESGLLGAFHFVFNRSSGDHADHRYLLGIGRLVRARRYVCVYIGTHAESVTSAHVLGWTGAIVRPGGGLRGILKRRGAQSGGTWHDSSFASLGDALRHYIFGSTHKT